MDQLSSIFQGMAGNFRLLSNLGNPTVSISIDGLKLALNSSVSRITTSTTTTISTVDSYIQSIAFTVEVAGAGSTITVRDKAGTPKVLVNALSGTAVSTVPIVVELMFPMKMTSGIDIVTSGAAPATWDVFVNFWK